MSESKEFLLFPKFLAENMLSNGDIFKMWQILLTGTKHPSMHNATENICKKLASYEKMKVVLTNETIILMDENGKELYKGLSSSFMYTLLPSFLRMHEFILVLRTFCD